MAKNLFFRHPVALLVIVAFPVIVARPVMYGMVSYDILWLHCMVFHAFTMLASARGLCLARRLYTSYIWYLIFDIWYLIFDMCISFFQLQPVSLTRLVNISCMFGVHALFIFWRLDITNPMNAYARMSARILTLAGLALFEQYLMRPCQAKGVQECFKTTLEEWLHLNSCHFCNSLENMMGVEGCPASGVYFVVCPSRHHGSKASIAGGKIAVAKTLGSGA